MNLRMFLSDAMALASAFRFGAHAIYPFFGTRLSSLLNAPHPLDGTAAKGSCINPPTRYGALTKAFQAENRLLAFTEPRPLAKLQPGCEAKAAVLLLYFVALLEVSPTRVGP